MANDTAQTAANAIGFFDLSRKRIDPKAQAEGLWFDVDEMDGCKLQFKIASVRNQQFRNFVQEGITKARGRNRNRDLPAGKVEDIAREAAARFLVRDWRTELPVLDDEGNVVYNDETGEAEKEWHHFIPTTEGCKEGQSYKKLVFSVDTCIDLLTRFPEYSEIVQSYADSDEEYRLENIKNLATKSSGVGALAV